MIDDEYLVWATPCTWLCTWLAWVCAAPLALAVIASSLAGLSARGACGAAVASLLAGMPTEQVPATSLTTSRVDVVAARHWPSHSQVCSTTECSKKLLTIARYANRKSAVIARLAVIKKTALNISAVVSHKTTCCRII